MDISKEAVCPRCHRNEHYGCSCNSLEMAEYWQDQAIALSARVEELERKNENLSQGFLNSIENAPKVYEDGRLQGLKHASEAVRMYEHKADVLSAIEALKGEQK